MAGRTTRFAVHSLGGASTTSCSPSTAASVNYSQFYADVSHVRTRVSAWNWRTVNVRFDRIRRLDLTDEEVLVGNEGERDRPADRGMGQGTLDDSCRVASRRKSSFDTAHLARIGPRKRPLANGRQTNRLALIVGRVVESG